MFLRGAYGKCFQWADTAGLTRTPPPSVRLDMKNTEEDSETSGLREGTDTFIQSI